MLRTVMSPRHTCCLEQRIKLGLALQALRCLHLRRFVVTALALTVCLVVLPFMAYTAATSTFTEFMVILNKWLWMGTEPGLEYEAQWLSLVGYLSSCDVAERVEYSGIFDDGSSVLRNRGAFRQIKDGDLVCLTGDQLIDDFVPNLLPLYRSSPIRFTVFTWIRPRSFPSELDAVGGAVTDNVKRQRMRRLLEDEHIEHVFSIDWDGGFADSGKVSAVPLGVDFHSKLYKYRLGLPSHPRAQEAAFNELVARSLAPDRYHRRKLLVFRDDMSHHRIAKWRAQSRRVVDGYLQFIAAANLSFDALYRWPHRVRQRLGDIVGDEEMAPFEGQTPMEQSVTFRVLRRNIARWNALYRIDEALIEMATERKSEREIYEMRSDYVFVLSPFGGGMDCYRMWEALIFGHIVITQQSPLDVLYEGLPVVSVRDWTQITRPALQQWYDRFFLNGTAQNNERVRQRLTTKYWIQKMKSVRAAEA